MSEKKWPILDNRTDQLSKQRPGKATIFFYALVVTSSVNSGYGRFEVVCHLLSSCVYASIPSISDFKVFH